MPEATLTSKGQITIPVAVREQLGLKAGDRIEFVVTSEGSATLTPRRIPFERLRGLLRSTKGSAVTVREMDEGIERAVGARWKRVSRQRGR